MGWYSENYKKKNKFIFNEDKDSFELPTRETEIKKIIEHPVEQAIRTIKKEPSKKIIYSMLLIPLILIIYIIYANFLVSKEFNYFYDIGNDNYLSPQFRVSEYLKENNITYRNLTGGLVYFSVPIPRNAEKIKIKTKFYPYFPDDYVMTIGAKDREEWHYKWNQLYNPALNRLDEFQNKEGVYLINKNKYLLPLDELKYERGVIIATDNPYPLLPNIILDYNKTETLINVSLRGGHTFYIYASGDLEVNVKKQDINWYDGSDELQISLYKDEVLVKNITIPDDGITTVNKSQVKIQTEKITINNLEEGVYKLEFSNFDGLIKEVKLNTNKIVAEIIFLADNELYNVETKPSRLYFESSRAGQIRLMTYHSVGIQNISYMENGVNKTFNFYQEDKPLYMNISAGKYEMSFPKNDIIVSAPAYFSFEKNQYFEPFKQVILPVKNDFDWIENNVDYLVTNYKKPTEDNGWLIAETEFDTKNNLYLKDNQLSLVFNIPHLTNPEFKNYTIPIDWINITVYKPGFINKNKMN